MSNFDVISQIFVAYFINKISPFYFYKLYANVERFKNWANKTRLDSIHSRRRSPSEEKKNRKKSLKDQKRKNRRSTPQCLVDIISEFPFLFLLTYIHTSWRCDFTRFLIKEKHEMLKKFLVKRQAYKKSKMKNTQTKMTSTHVPFHSAP